MAPRTLQLLTLAIAATTCPLHAQEPEKKPAPPRALRLLPLGEPPPFRQEIRDGIRYELEPPAGSIPPRQVVIGPTPDAATATPQPENEPTRLNLGRFSESLKIPAGTAPILLRDAANPADPAAKPWLRIVPPESGDALAIIWRDPGATWLTPRAIVFPESPTAFPAGSFRLLNLTPAEIGVTLAGRRTLLQPAKSTIQAIPVGTDHPLQIAYNDGSGNFIAFHTGSVLLNRGERGQIIIHRADGEKPRRPVRVSIFNEITPAPPAPAP